MTAAQEVVAQARAAGLRLAPNGEKLRVEPAPPADLRAALSNAKAEILAVLRAERSIEVSLAISAAYDRLNALGPWTPVDVSAQRDLGAALDLSGRSYMQGDGDRKGFDSALKRWEAVLSAGRTPRPMAAPAADQVPCAGCRRCGPRSVAFLDFDDGARICGRCGAEVAP